MAAVVLALLVLLWLLFDWNWFREPIEQRVQEATGREFAIDGDFDVRMGWPPTVVADGVRLANAEWGEEPYMLVAERVEARVRPMDALRGRWRFPSVVLHQPRLLVEWNEQGVSNWEALVDDEEDENGIDVDRLVISNGEVLLRDPARETRVRLQVDSEAVADHDGEVPMQLSGEGQVRGKPFSIEGRVDSPLLLGEPDRGYQVNVQAQAGDTRAHARGELSASDPLQAFNLRLALAGEDLAELDELLDIGVPSSPPYRIDGRLRRDGELWRYSEMSGSIASSQWSGDIAIDLSAERPFVRGTLQASVALPDVEEPERVFPTRDLGLQRLHKVDGDVQLGLRVLDDDGDALFVVQRADVSLRDGRGRVDPLTLELAGGRIDGAVDFDANRDPVHFDIRGDLRELRLPQLLPDAVLEQGSGGRIVGELAVSGQGRSVAEFVADASGDLSLLMGPSRLMVANNNDDNGIDVAGLLGFESLDEDPVVIRCAYADFAIRDGQMVARSLAVDSEDTVIIGEGRIRLEAERWDLQLHPRQKDVGFSPLRSPLQVEGPLLQPELDPEIGQMAIRGLAAGALAAITPPAALLALVDPGEGEDFDCAGIVGAELAAGVDDDE